VKPEGDLGMDISGSPRQSTTGALGDETAHGDSSLAAWKSHAHKPGLGVGIDQDGAGGITV
jgi:hypothetical protein